MLTTTIVDIMVNIIADVVLSNNVLAKAFEIVDLVFMYDIQKANGPEHYKNKSCSYLRKLETKLRGSEKVLLFPIYIPERLHFISGEINFKKRTITYGVWNGYTPVNS